MAPIPAAKYRRISADREGRRLGIKVQDRDLDALAEQRGLEWVDDYFDNDMSASTQSDKPRPDFNRMIADAKAGRFKVIAAYTTGRLTRNPEEFEREIIKLGRYHGIQFMYVKSPEFDLTLAQGRSAARNRATRDAEEAEEISERVTAAVRRRAMDGEFHGGKLLFGLEGERGVKVDQGARKYVYVGIHPHPVHAEWMREAARRVLAGETLSGITKDWHNAGRRRGESTWNARMLRLTLCNPGMVGKREYNGQLLDAPWDAILDMDDWHRLRSLLTGRAPIAAATNARKYALSGLVYCDLCKHRLISAGGRKYGGGVKGASFECSRIRGAGGCGRIRINMAPLDDFMSEQLFAVADTPELHAAMAQRGGVDDGEYDRLRKAVEHDEAQLVTIQDEYDDGDIDRATYRRRHGRISDRLQANREALTRATRATAPIPSGDTLRALWPTKSAEWKRAMYGQVIDRIYIKPHPAGWSVAAHRRGTDTDEMFAARAAEHNALLMEQRVLVKWLY